MSTARLNTIRVAHDKSQILLHVPFALDGQHISKGPISDAVDIYRMQEGMLTWYRRRWNNNDG